MLMGRKDVGSHMGNQEVVKVAILEKCCNSSLVLKWFRLETMLEAQARLHTADAAAISLGCWVRDVLRGEAAAGNLCNGLRQVRMAKT